MPIINLLRSLPARGAWIEITEFRRDIHVVTRRSPHGERGLKLILVITALAVLGSLPARGAWIEIFPWPQQLQRRRRSLPARGAWIEISGVSGAISSSTSRSPHGERGLKYHLLLDVIALVDVAPRTGSVD